MILTEEEAKTKRCQESFGDGFASAGAAQAMGVPVNPYGHSWQTGTVAISSPTTCIGSACMAWRWIVEGNTIAGFEVSKSLGYCGKAGKP